jgi:hypothetical protein
MAVEDQAHLADAAGREPRRDVVAGGAGDRLRSVGGRLSAGGTDGNEHLTASTGVVLLALLAALGVTIVRVGQLLSIHMFLGMLLIGPIALKLASTGYRFIRYYTAEPRYRRKGPPPMFLRLLAPVVVLSTIVVFASGVALMLIGPSSRHPLLLVHKASFFVWLAATGVHVLGHLGDLPRTLGPAESRRAGVERPLPGNGGRALALGAALVAGVVLAVLSISQFGPWTHAHFFHH